MARPEAEAFAAKHNADVAAKKAAAGLVGDPPAAGHNSGPPVKDYFKRRLALEQEKQTLAEDIRELNAEMKEHDIDPRAVAINVKREMEDVEKKAKRLALQETVDSYASILGFLD